MPRAAPALQWEQWIRCDISGVAIHPTADLRFEGICGRAAPRCGIQSACGAPSRTCPAISGTFNPDVIETNARLDGPRSSREAQGVVEEEQYFFVGQGSQEEGDASDPPSVNLDLERLKDASGLDTPLEWELLPPECIPPPQITPYHSVI
ncbi:hypothetical protein NDU88_007181 [Pleurodeles waltl]|uniref:Uncharacterized protein n=1 Tax=Pleurodeles waltl TaxID=8319 RepID=A0AAV7MPJ2_PLEWA|nr:hypothetical protein NDU88_007181 [Pleurodeles waltl]